jgi:hypothetical protein
MVRTIKRHHHHKQTSALLKTSVRMEYRYCIRLPGGRGTENARLAVNVKSRFSTDKDQEMLLYLVHRFLRVPQSPHASQLEKMTSSCLQNFQIQ